jgi:Ser-tRNA(Ala) deacylase AlaX
MELSRCQSEDAYQREATATVRAVRSADEGFDVVLTSTIFYPEGGGQPADRGALGGADVVDVQRAESGEIVHRVASAPDLDESVELRLDWRRRFDLMQQHTAQHLITAIADDEFDLPTTSFHLGEDYSAIELDAEVIGPKILEKLEARVNEEIRRAVDVGFRFVERDLVDTNTVRSRALPAGLGDEIRLVEIDGIDLNTCGGTHVRSTAELQVIKFIGTDPARGGTRLSYLAGGRVIAWMQSEIERRDTLNGLLSCGASDWVDSIEKLLDDVKTANRELRSAREELSTRLGRSLAQESGRLVVAHRRENDFKFLESVAQAALDYDGTDVVFLTAADTTHDGGIFLLAGPPELVSEVGDRAAELLDGRGGGRPGRYQGKAAQIDNRDQVRDLLRAALPR